MSEDERVPEATEQITVQAEASGGSLLGAIVGVASAAFTGIAMATAMVWNSIMEDGVLEAAGRQGIDELGHALQAFPHSIHAEEVGTIFNPTQGEIAADRGGDQAGGLFQSTYYASYSHSAAPQETWPSEIASTNSVYDPQQDLSNDQGHSL